MHYEKSSRNLALKSTAARESDPNMDGSAAAAPPPTAPAPAAPVVAAPAAAAPVAAAPVAANKSCNMGLLQKGQGSRMKYEVWDMEV